jgi:hypothetical protein
VLTNGLAHLAQFGEGMLIGGVFLETGDLVAGFGDVVTAFCGDLLGDFCVVGGGLGRFTIRAHFEICLSTFSCENFLPQCGLLTLKFHKNVTITIVCNHHKNRSEFPQLCQFLQLANFFESLHVVFSICWKSLVLRKL